MFQIYSVNILCRVCVCLGINIKKQTLAMEFLWGRVNIKFIAKTVSETLVVKIHLKTNDNSVRKICYLPLRKTKGYRKTNSILALRLFLTSRGHQI